jgi:hypothetical protein
VVVVVMRTALEFEKGKRRERREKGRKEEGEEGEEEEERRRRVDTTPNKKTTAVARTRGFNLLIISLVYYWANRYPFK